MRPLRNVLLLAMEVGVFVLGLVLTVIITAYLQSALAFVVGLVLTTSSLVIIRQRSRKAELEYHATRWMAKRSSRQLHPRQTRYTRTMCRYLPWFPSLCAALVLFFLPVASHIVYPGPHLVRHYRFSTPLNWMILRSFGDGAYSYAWAFFSSEGAARYGLTPIWFNHSFPSGATFASDDPAKAYIWWRPESEMERGHTTHIGKTEFKLGVIAVDCWEYQDTIHYAEGVLWEVLCSTRPNGRDFNLHASFLGHKEDIPAFYRVLKGATPAD